MPSKKAKAQEKAAQKDKYNKEQEAKQKEEEVWEVGTNKRSQKKEAEKNAKYDERLQNEKAVQELLLAEAESMGNGSKGKKPKSKRVKGDTLDLLYKSLADTPKSKAQISIDNAKEEAKRREEEKHQRLELEREKELEYMKKGMVVQDQLEGNNGNNNFDDIDTATGIDDALDLLNDGVTVTNNVKVLFKAFYDEQLLIIKENIPGLRLSSYNDKISKLWKQSPMNPHNSRN
jgi:hypothetical protein